ncbi:MAG: response regulator transcription factor [Nitrosomonas sp.]|nr:response regulator transcription factor [Nitrosomonas sp.]MCP5250683.1 response regulator transcription factor [Burkholderiales bacterium]MCP5252809.1 response regulator transcription factor [Burkholderiales bacterium]MCP5291197.1 response regulator transcription factor [Burkholderiales bacterium]MDR4519802.1 response regulator transcription factor [Nitrosomonas sp.]
MHILIIEDDMAIAANLYDFFESHGHSVDAAADGAVGLHLAATQQFDAILLDLGLPGMSGLALCHKLRNELRIDTPILMLTARDTLEDKLTGFEHGADDYLVKPFALKEVEARLSALHKRHSGRVANRTLEVGNLFYDPKTFSIRFENKDVKLPPKCVRLLALMMSEPGRVFSRKELESEAWENTQETSDTLRSHMHVLRRALTRVGGYDPIETVHGIGYCLTTSCDKPHQD